MRWKSFLYIRAAKIRQRIERATDSLRTNPNMYWAWDKSKKYGKLQWIAFLWFAVIPICKLLCGKGHDYAAKLKKDDCILELSGAGGGILFYLPLFEQDCIQQEMVLTKNFFERVELGHLQRFIRNGDVCLDIGANIGNHSIYYAMICHASKIFAFEPVQSTFEILKKNIKLNHLENCIEAHNVGMSNRTKSASIVHFEENNIGATQLSENNTGDLQLVALDDMDFPAVDFVKIDVEGMEHDLLRGAKQFFAKHNPILFIEIWNEHFEQVDALLQDYGYALFEKRPTENYIYRRK